jgi:glycosyltransferase involved in cell wall biosynthesis
LLKNAGDGMEVEALAGRAAYDFLRDQVDCRFHVVPTHMTAWDTLLLPDLITRVGADLYHSPLFVLPSVRVVPYVATIHDVIPLVRPDLTTPDFETFFSRHIRGAVNHASHIVTVSEHSRQDCIRHLSIDPERITAIHEPVSPRFGRARALSDEVLREKYRLESGFILSVGALDRRKNLSGLLAAYRLLCEMDPDAPPLVFVGAPSGDGFDLQREAEAAGLQERVRLLGRVTDEVLAELYASAGMLAFPSFYEGFGLPVVEAMVSGTPVVASRAASIPEIAGDAALLVDPENPQEMASALYQVLHRWSSPLPYGFLPVFGFASSKRE